MKPILNILMTLAALFMPQMLMARTETLSNDTAVRDIPAMPVDFTAIEVEEFETVGIEPAAVHDSIIGTDEAYENLYRKLRPRASLYELPYSLTRSEKNWKRLWTNTAVLGGAYISTLVVLECLPEDATSWNRAAIRNTPWYKRWYNHVIKEGPTPDCDNPVFNYILHPYAGAVYFMAARSNGFNYFQSLLYSACISTIGWEFGIEATMERPSIQDIFITPLLGSVFGECFYLLKREIVSHDYRLFGSKVVGNIVAFLVDPVNEVVGLFAGNEARRLHLGRKAPKLESSFAPMVFPTGQAGFTFSCRF
ncbi:MAG: DUF3943 domain-containing protein [Muribaculaceae bacterium]|nr:DUF3943 domain-containing protein [Muribaculaceae bacterium]